jgi:carbonic anhydrase
VLVATLALGACTIEITTGTPTPPPPPGPDEALARLMEGNKRYVAGSLSHPNQSLDRRGEVAKGQAPFAIILGCADSRVGPELLFDQGLGDLFVVRVAGNVLNDNALGSIEYAAEHLHSPLVVVLGHQKCGAVEATLKGGAAPGQIGSLVRAIQPAVDKVKGQPGDPLDNAIKANVELVVSQLRASKPILTELAEHGKLKIVGARYKLDSGEIEWFDAGAEKAAGAEKPAGTVTPAAGKPGQPTAKPGPGATPTPKH